MDEDDRAAVAKLLNVDVRAVAERRGGFGTAHCWSVELTNGRRVFVKVAGDDDAAAGNRNEVIVLSAVGSPHLPAFIAATDDGHLLVTEDLSDGDWDPPIAMLDDLWPSIAEIGSHPGPPQLWLSFQGAGRDPWTDVLADNRFAGAIGVEPQWFDRHGETLAAAARRADTSGDRLVHGDLAPGNWCRTAQGQWKFVDWASAYRGNPVIDDVIAAIRLTRLRGEPAHSTRTGNHPEIATFVAGRFAGELLDVDWSAAPPAAQADRVADIQAGLSLAAHLLALPAPA